MSGSREEAQGGEDERQLLALERGRIGTCIEGGSR